MCLKAVDISCDIQPILNRHKMPVYTVRSGIQQCKGNSAVQQRGKTRACDTKVLLHQIAHCAGMSLGDLELTGVHLEPQPTGFLPLNFQHKILLYEAL